MKTSNTKTSKLNVSLVALTALAMFMALAGCGHEGFGDRDRHDDHHEEHHEEHHDQDH